MDPTAVRGILVEMGYESDVAGIAIKQASGLKGAVDWLEEHNFTRAGTGTAPAAKHHVGAVTHEPKPQVDSAVQDSRSHAGSATQAPERRPPPPPPPQQHPPELAKDRTHYSSSAAGPSHHVAEKYDSPPSTQQVHPKLAEDRAHYGTSEAGPSHHQDQTHDAPPAYEDHSRDINGGFSPDHKGHFPSDHKGSLLSRRHGSNASPPMASPPQRPLASPPQRPLASPPQPAPVEDRDVGHMRSFFKRMGGDEKEAERNRQKQLAATNYILVGRWGDLESPTREIVDRYWIATRMAHHWDYMRVHHSHQFKHYVERGYCEPIPIAWVQGQVLAVPNPEGSYWEDPAEERLYYFLNNGDPPDGLKQGTLRPLNINRDRHAIVRRGEQRNKRAHPLDPARLAAYQSPQDVWHADREIRTQAYSSQVDNIEYAARTRALHELAAGLTDGRDHLETMLLIDVSGSMTWNPHDGIPGPDGVMRYHDQPSNIQLVEHLVHRVLYHMVARARRTHPQQRGIDTVAFSTRGTYVGQLSTDNFQEDWGRIRLGGGTQVMQGWQVVKTTYFEMQNRAYGHGRWDATFGWQPTPGMPKLSLLIFLDGEALDMDEFELELLGETWAYVTIALVGMEGCPHHHSHAVELERVARFNPHVGFFDVHGRVCERIVVEDLLRSVYPVDPPAYAEITRPEFDLPEKKAAAYRTYGQQ